LLVAALGASAYVATPLTITHKQATRPLIPCMNSCDRGSMVGERAVPEQAPI